MDKITLFERAWNLWGANAQYAMLAEECCELAKAALKQSRNFNGSNKFQLMEEIVDVELMIESVKHNIKLSIAEMESIRLRKLDRLATIITGG
jgi:NTP pyrophosphatase (non-canonical NTP hydrolase)